jgi:ABC-type multidrug transport system fused ATPase/permease subunit
MPNESTTTIYNSQSVMRDYYLQRPNIMLGYVVSMLTMPIGAVAIPALMGELINRLRAGQSFTQWRPQLLVAIVLVLVMFVAYVIGTYQDAILTTDLQAAVRRDVFRRVLQAHSRCYRELPTSDIVAKIVKMPQSATYVARVWRHSILPGALTMLAIAIYMSTIDWRMGALMVLTMVAMGGLLYASHHVCSCGIVAASYDNDTVYENVGDVLDNLIHVYLSDAAEAEVQRLDSIADAHRARMRRALMCTNHFTSQYKLFLALIVTGIVVYAWKRHRAGFFGVGTFIGLIFVLMCSRSIIYDMLTFWPALMVEQAELDKMDMYIDSLVARGSTGDGVLAASETHTITHLQAPLALVLQELTFRYPGAGTPTLQAVSLTLPVGARLRVRGPIGCGKSTLAKVILGLHRPTSGTVQLSGFNVNAISRAQLARLVSYVPQTVRLLDRTVFENLALGLPNLTRTRAATVLHDFGVDFVGLDDSVGKGGGRLSGGQRAVLYLARVVLRDTPVVICDELTANLDPAARVRILALLRHVVQGRTLIFITHDMTADVGWTHDLQLVDGRMASFTTLK